jgi:hypothetical protein
MRTANGRTRVSETTKRSTHGTSPAAARRERSGTRRLLALRHALYNDRPRSVHLPRHETKMIIAHLTLENIAFFYEKRLRYREPDLDAVAYARLLRRAGGRRSHPRIRRSRRAPASAGHGAERGPSGLDAAGRGRRPSGRFLRSRSITAALGYGAWRAYIRHPPPAPTKAAKSPPRDRQAVCRSCRDRRVRPQSPATTAFTRARLVSARFEDGSETAQAERDASRIVPFAPDDNTSIHPLLAGPAARLPPHERCRPGRGRRKSP